MIGRFDNQENTLGHIAALIGNSKLFKVKKYTTIAIMNSIWHFPTLQVVFPLASLKLEPAVTGDAQATSQFGRLISLGESAQQKVQKGQFAVLMWENSDGKTPLHLAIENKHTWCANRLHLCITITFWSSLHAALYKRLKNVWMKGSQSPVLNRTWKNLHGKVSGKSGVQNCFSMRVPMDQLTLSNCWLRI